LFEKIYVNGPSLATKSGARLKINAVAGRSIRIGTVDAVALYPDRGELFRNYPETEPEDVQLALAFTAANLEDTARETMAA
jgi:hypothetical protein